MNDSIDFVILGAVLGAILAGIVGVIIDHSPFSNSFVYQKAIEQCEKDLSRDQHCKIIAVPETKGGE